MTHAVAAARLGPLPALLDRPVTGPVVRVPTPTGDEVWLVTDHTVARRVLTDPRFSRAAAARPEAPKTNTANPAPSSIMSTDGARHARLRRLVAASFSPRRIAALAPRVQHLVDRRLDELATLDRPVDLIAGYAAPLPVEVISELLGIPVGDRSRMQEWAGVLFDVTASTPAQKARRSYALFAYMSTLVDRKRAEPADDLISALVSAHDAGVLGRTELIDLALAVLTAGYETTVGQIGLSVFAFLRDPEPRSELLGEATAAAVVEEYLRLVPATPMTFPRVATEDVALGGVTIRAGEAVVVSLLHANLDPAAFPDPGRLEPAGRPAGHLTFGHGEHFCLGAGLARLQVRIATRTLLHRLPGLRLADHPRAVGWYEGLATCGLTQLWVTW